MKVALFGGTFDPPHLGHMLIAQQVLDFGSGIDAVWFLPTYRHSFQKSSASAEDRLMMTQTIMTPHTSVCTLEIDHRLRGQTIELLPYLPKEHSYVFVIGSDQLPTFHLWGQWQELLKKMPFLVFPRYGYALEPLYPGMTVISDPSLIATDISSTKIRERVKRGLSVRWFVSEDVGKYITTHKLYI